MSHAVVSPVQSPPVAVGREAATSLLENGVRAENTFFETFTSPKYYRIEEPSMVLGADAHVIKVNTGLAKALGINVEFAHDPDLLHMATKVFGGAAQLNVQCTTTGSTATDGTTKSAAENSASTGTAVDSSARGSSAAAAHSTTAAVPIAMAYAGHQFGSFVPALGDGRAVLLGELRHTGTGTLYDVQLKGSGPTAFARNGDGYSALGPVLREYIISEYMHVAGVPTTRALTAVRTGRPVYRQEGMLPGGVFTRVARCLIRVGTFEYFASRGDIDAIKQVANYCINRNFPEIIGRTTGNTADRYKQMFHEVVVRQACLIAQWMSIGFIHGVMNTDNCCIAGDTIDYGPCAFMDDFSSSKKFSAIDTHGRYAWSKQAGIGHWNMGRLALALESVLTDECATNSSGSAVYSKVNSSGGSFDPRSAFLQYVQMELACYQTTFEHAFNTLMNAKIGLCSSYYFRCCKGTDKNDVTSSTGSLLGDILSWSLVDTGACAVDPLDKALLEMLLTTMEEGHADYTHTFRSLSHVDLADSTTADTDASAVRAGGTTPSEEEFVECFSHSSRESAKSWLRLWRSRLEREAIKYKVEVDKNIQLPTGNESDDTIQPVTTSDQKDVDQQSTDKSVDTGTDASTGRQSRCNKVPDFDGARRRLMCGVNPLYIPRNHVVERIIQSGVKHNDYTDFNRLIDTVLPHAFEGAYPDCSTGATQGTGGLYDSFGRPPKDSEVVQRTFCGT